MPIAGIIRQSSAGYLIELKITERGMQLAKAGAVSLLCPWLQARQVIEGEPFQSVLIGSAQKTTTIEPTMLFQHLCEELLCNGL